MGKEHGHYDEMKRNELKHLKCGCGEERLLSKNLKVRICKTVGTSAQYRSRQIFTYVSYALTQVSYGIVELLCMVVKLGLHFERGTEVKSVREKVSRQYRGTGGVPLQEAMGIKEIAVQKTAIGVAQTVESLAADPEFLSGKSGNPTGITKDRYSAVQTECVCVFVRSSCTSVVIKFRSSVNNLERVLTTTVLDVPQFCRCMSDLRRCGRDSRPNNDMSLPCPVIIDVKLMIQGYDSKHKNQIVYSVVRSAILAMPNVPIPVRPENLKHHSIDTDNVK
ncbi:hypothetical protein ANN_26194 [Periplaneta americana]|uniref:Uncharacterized protein n=1 Tax=Periplaneta americana TaxID=6978 RepID=A0ABQ8S599_PERAM|nr:hypothetical protein ANN_26194 [Periplaneta americana]